MNERAYTMKELNEMGYKPNPTGDIMLRESGGWMESYVLSERIGETKLYRSNGKLPVPSDEARRAG